jgi:3-dehydroquinate synthase
MNASCHPTSHSPALPIRIAVPLADRSYDILIQDGLLDHLGTHVAQMAPHAPAVIVSNKVVLRLYGRRALRSLKAAGIASTVITVPDGEQAKSMKWLGAILDDLVRRRCERDTCLIALGGGVVGDLAGFAASAYLRGIPLVQVPTTLLSQVDASIGGKTAVNHRLGKNLIGTFYQPKLVLIDPGLLRSLPVREYRAGMAEVIKYGAIEDAGFFEFLEHNMASVMNQEPASMARVLRTSCAIKAAIVSADEREGDRRRVLNFGHTLGHALETVSSYRRYKHGETVAIGMVAAAGLAVTLGLTDRAVRDRVSRVVKLAGLPAAVPRYPVASLMRAMRQDKKVQLQQIYFVLPTEIGKVMIRPVDHDVIRRFLAGERDAGRGRQASLT